MIYTVGYKGKTLQQVVNIMDAHKIDVLVDVRSLPRSKYKEFNRAVLEWRLKQRYRWEGDRLGGLERVRSPFYEEGLEWIRNANMAGKNVLVMCMEEDPDKCHRKKWIATDLERMFGLKVEHL